MANAGDALAFTSEGFMRKTRGDGGRFPPQKGEVRWTVREGCNVRSAVKPRKPSNHMVTPVVTSRL